MKFIYNITFALFLFFSQNILFAQPVLTLESQTPTIGDIYEVVLYDMSETSFSPGNAGANQNWDFSQFGLNEGLSISFSILKPADAPANADFPEADFVWLLNGFDTYNYYKIEENSLNLIGGVAASGNDIFFKQIYTKAEERLKFPATFEDQYAYSSTFKSVFFNLEMEANRNGDVQYDAYGTLKTPYGTYGNVLRMKIVSSSTEVPDAMETQYAWILPGEFIPLAVYTISTDPEETPSLYFAQPQLVNKLGQALKYDYGLRLIANPVKDRLQLEGLENLPKGSQLSIVSLNGYKELIPELNNPNIPLKAGSSGMYYLILEGPKGVQTIPFVRY